MSADVNTVNNFTGFDSPAGSIDKPGGFAVSTIFPGNQNQPFLPGIAFGGGVPFQGLAESTGFEFFFWDPQTAFKDNLVWSKGKHTLKMGFFLLDNHINTTTNIGLNTQGSFFFDPTATGSTGNALADMFLGVIQNYSEYGRMVGGQLVGGPGLGHWRQWDFEPYIQDDWRLTPRLTLNLGLRYYYLTPFWDSITPTNDSIFVPTAYSAANQAQLDGNGNLIPGTGATYLNYGNGLEQCGSGGVPKGCSKSDHNTYSPRFGFSWDPFGTGKTVVRGGYALNWDSSNPLHAGAGFNGNPPTAASLNIYNVAGFRASAPGAGNGRFFRYSDGTKVAGNLAVQPGRTTPVAGKQSVERQLRGNSGASPAANVEHQPDTNRLTTQTVPQLIGTNTLGCDNVTGVCDVQTVMINSPGNAIFFAPYRGYTGIGLRSPSGNSNYNAMQLSLRHPTTHGLMYEVSYTWSHTLDDITVPNIDDTDIRRWYGTSSLNQAQVLVINWVYEPPFFKQSPNAFARHLLGGWQIGGISSFMTGPPINFNCGLSGFASGIGEGVMCNPLGPLQVKKGSLVDPNLGTPSPSGSTQCIGQVTMAQLQANDQPGMFGTMSKNPMRGPGRNNWDLALMRNFRLPWFGGESSNLQFRLETFNTFNHPQWQGVNTDCTSTNAATVPGAACTGGQLGEINSAFPPRILQLGLKFAF